MYTPKRKPSFFYRVLFVGVLFSFATADIAPSAISQVAAPSVNSVSSVPITLTSSAPTVSSESLNPVVFAPLHPASIETDSASLNSAPPAKLNQSSINGRDHPQDKAVRSSEQKPNSTKQPPNSEGRLDWQNHDRFKMNTNQDTPKPSLPQDLPLNVTNRTGPFNVHFNETKIELTPRNGAQEHEFVNKVLGNQTAHQNVWNDQRSQPQSAKSIAIEDKKPQRRFNHNQQRNDGSQREKEQGPSQSESRPGFDERSGRSGRFEVEDDKRGLQERNDEERVDHQRCDKGEAREQKEVRDKRNHMERREEYFDEDEWEGVNSFDNDEDYKRGQSSRIRYNRREGRNIERWEDDGQLQEDDGWEEQDRDERPSRRPSRSERDYDEEDEDYAEERDSRAPHYRSKRASSRGQGSRGSSRQQRSSSGRSQRGRRSGESYQRPNIRRYD